MTTLLTREQTDALRSIGDGALVLFAMAMVDANYPGRITKPAELLPYLYPNYKDIRKLTTQLNALSASGRLAQNGSGYVLLEGGRALLLEMSGTLEYNDLAQSPALAAGTLNDQALTVPQTEAGAPKHVNSARAMRAQDLTLKKEEEEELILKDQDGSSSSDSAQNALEIAPGVTTQRILLATSMLDGFGDDGVFLHGIDVDVVPSWHALGWIAQAFDQRAKLGNPAGLVYSRLKDADQPKPRAKYQHWENYLPDEFLQDIGWLVIQCDSCGVEFETREALEKHQELLYRCEDGCGARFHTREELHSHHETHRSKNPAVPMVMRLPADHRGSQAWELVLKELLVDLPRASFDTWVRDVTPTGFEGGVMTLAARNAYAMDWLNDRLTVKLEAMLKTFLHEEIRVQFVVGCPTEENE